MSDLPLNSYGKATGIGGVAATSAPTTVTAGAAHTKGSYSELSASAPFDVFGASIIIGQYSGLNGHDSLWDIAIGGAGSEQTIVNNLLMSHSNADSWRESVYLPDFRCAVGTRIAVRYQAPTASATCTCGMILYGGTLSIPNASFAMDTYGANTATSGGTSVDPGGSANTAGAWVQLSASVTRPMRNALIRFGCVNNTAQSDANWMVDIGIGGAGSEVVLASGIVATSTQVEHRSGGAFLGCAIPAGQRLAARAQCSSIDAIDRVIGVIVIGGVG